MLRSRMMFPIGCLLAIVLFIMFDKGPAVKVTEIFPELNIEAIDTVFVYDLALNVQLEPEEIDELKQLLARTDFKKKRISNANAFSPHAGIGFFTEGSDVHYTLKFDENRPIIGLSFDQNRMRQYVVEMEADILTFVDEKLMK